MAVQPCTNLNFVYTEMNEADRNETVDICVNALKTQEKSDTTVYQKDVAKAIKTDLDSKRGARGTLLSATLLAPSYPPR